MCILSVVFLTSNMSFLSIVLYFLEGEGGGGKDGFQQKKTTN